MSEEPPLYDLESLNNIVELFSEAEEAIKYIEDFGGELVVPAINQLRYTGNHLVRYLGKMEPDELRDAAKHAKRATYDAYEAVIVYHLLEYKKFQDDYRKVQIIKAVPDYPEIQASIEEARKFIRENSESKTRGDNYRNGKDHFDLIVCKVRLLNACRGELNKLIKKERMWFFFQIYGVVGVVATIAATVVAYLQYSCPK